MGEHISTLIQSVKGEKVKLEDLPEMYKYGYWSVDSPNLNMQ